MRRIRRSGFDRVITRGDESAGLADPGYRSSHSFELPGRRAPCVTAAAIASSGLLGDGDRGYRFHWCDREQAT